MKKFDIFARSPHARKWCAGGFVLAASRKDAANFASDKYLGKFVKVLPALILL